MSRSSVGASLMAAVYSGSSAAVLVALPETCEVSPLMVTHTSAFAVRLPFLSASEMPFSFTPTTNCVRA